MPATTAEDRSLLVTFERVGRNRAVEPLMVPAPRDQADIAELTHQIYDYAGQFLASSEWSVSLDVDLATGIGAGTISAGRSGRFTITPAPAKAPEDVS